MRWLLILVILTLLVTTDAPAAGQCSVRAVPRVSTAPLRYVRATATVERDPLNVRIDIALFGPSGLVSSTQIWERGWTEHPRTREVEWKDILEGGGNYEVILQVGRGDGSVCRAVERLFVAE